MAQQPPTMARTTALIALFSVIYGAAAAELKVQKPAPAFSGATAVVPDGKVRHASRHCHLWQYMSND